jgi:glucosamine--fructose-6-phosphate aminotransferase (isomerizing)
MEKIIPKTMQNAFDRKAHPYYMWEGIQKISAGLEDILNEENRQNIIKAAKAIRGKPAVHFMGCGTSYFVSIAATYIFHALCGVQSTASNSFEFITYPPPNLEHSVVVGISHTGKTPTVVQAIERTKEAGAVTLGFTDAADSALGQTAEYVIASALGEEPALPKTRSYCASLLRAYLLAVELAQLENKDTLVYREILQQSPMIAQQILETFEKPIQELANSITLPKRIIIAGGGPQWATANEASLKLIEAALYHSDAWELEEAVHGTWASTRAGDLIIIPAMRGGSLSKCQKLATGMKTIGATVWALTDDAGTEINADYHSVLPGGIPELVLPLFTILPLYQFTYFLALRQGIHPDNMNLADPRYLEARTLMREFIK